ncbi:hypothetical protein EAH74_20185 [Pseudomonas mandelii]|uniref:Uncharacterized protein n=1 Tax=Pseudomonas mandelii TaxID=75612 RepID=A0A502I9J6_9PSED|nr:hypothetical protein EAH74_20185 [Pseudomonas mandelii]
MGASLLAKAVGQSTLMSAGTPSSRAGSLPQVGVRSRQSPPCKTRSLQFAFTLSTLRNVPGTVHKDTGPQ